MCSGKLFGFQLIRGFAFPQRFRCLINIHAVCFRIFFFQISQNLTDICGFIIDEFFGIRDLLGLCAQVAQTVGIDADPGDNLFRDLFLISSVFLHPADNLLLIVLHLGAVAFEFFRQIPDTGFHIIDLLSEICLLLVSLCFLLILFGDICLILLIQLTILPAAREAEHQKNETKNRKRRNQRVHHRRSDSAADDQKRTENHEYGAHSLCGFFYRRMFKHQFGSFQFLQCFIQIIGLFLFLCDGYGDTLFFLLFLQQ